MKITDLAVSHKVPTFMAVVSLVILGAVSVRQIPKELLPHVTFSFMGVTAHYMNYRNMSTPEQTERRVTIPLEKVLRTLPHLKKMESSTRSNQAQVGLQFDSGVDMQLMIQQVRDKVNSIKSELPEDLGPVGIWMFRTDDVPILATAMMYGDQSRQPGILAQKKLSSTLTRVEGVAQADIHRGATEERVTVDVSQDALKSTNVSMLQLVMALADANVELDLGSMVAEKTTSLVRVASKLTTVEEIRALPIPGSRLRVGDVAQVTMAIPPRTQMCRIDGQDAWLMFVLKESGANIVDAAKRATQALRNLEMDPLFEGCKFIAFFDQSEAITSTLNALRRGGIEGAVFALLFLFLFLRRLGSTMIVGISIPVCIIATFNFMHLAHITLNVASMAGMMFAVGMLVDDAIVVCENIFRMREEGLSARESVIAGARGVGAAVTSSTVTTAVVFLPAIYVMESDFGEFLKEFGLTITFAMMTSLLLSLTLVPLLALRFLPSRESDEYAFFGTLRRWSLWTEGWILRHRAMGIMLLLFVLSTLSLRSFSKSLDSPDTLATSCPLLFREGFSFHLAALIEAFKRVRPGFLVLLVGGLLFVSIDLILNFPRTQNHYVSLLRTTLRRRPLTLFVTALIVVLSFSLAVWIEREEYPGLMESRVGVDVQMPKSYNFDQCQETMLKLEKWATPRCAMWGVDTLITRYTQGEDGRLNFFFEDQSKLKRPAKEIRDEIFASLPQTPGLRYQLEREETDMSSGEEISVVLKGYDSALLLDVAQEVKERLRLVDEVEDIRIGQEDPEQEIHLEIDREAALSYGIKDLRQVSMLINAALSGQKVGEMRTIDGTTDIFVQLRKEDRENIEALRKLSIPNAKMELVPLENIAQFSLREGPKSLERMDGRSVLSVVGTTNRKGTQALAREIKARLEGLQLPEGYSFQLGGRFQEAEKEISNIWLVLVFSCLLIFLVLATQFESVIHPFAIMFTFPFATVGVLWALFLTGTTLNIISGCGIIVLAGMVVRNAIVMVDHINALRRQGYERTEAVLLGCQHRFRPVLMTSLATIIGLFPMATGSNDSQFVMYSAMGKAMEGGMISSTFLTLLLLPLVYTLFDDLHKIPGVLSRWFRRGRRDVSRPS